MSIEFNGIAASSGIAIAPAYLLSDPDLSYEKKKVSDPRHEIERLKKAIQGSKDELATIKKHVSKTMGEEEAEVFEAHITMLNDPELLTAMENEINDEQVNAEEALFKQTSHFISVFESMDDNEYMQARAADVADIQKRVMGHLLGLQLPNTALIDSQRIIVASDLTPSDTAQLDRKYVKGFITDLGGRTSHSAIMSRTLEIPAVVGTERATTKIKNDDTVIVDGIEGHVIVNPSDSELERYQKKQEQYAEQRKLWQQMKNQPSVSADGKYFTIGANIGTPADITAVTENGGEAVGLMRSEFLYMDATELPTEEEQFQAYKKVVTDMNGKQVVIRTMDIGGDKHLDYLPLPEEMNPFLGYRAIRISLDRQQIFRTQLRALIRASEFGQLAVMFPMIATVNEFKQAKKIFEEEKTKLVEEGVPVGTNIQVGMMMEIPAAAMIADKLAKYVDFFSIGTNDLIQYSFAADRGNEHVSYLYQPYNPSLLKLIKNTIDASHQEGKWTGMCGEMAGDQAAVPILMGLGLDEFSMSATSMLQTRALMSTLDVKECQKLAAHALEAESNEAVIALVENFKKSKN